MTQKIKRAMVLAAGKGTRLGELTQKTPKPLVDLGGTTPLELTLQNLDNYGVAEIIINCHWLGEQIIDQVKKWQKEGTFKAKLIVSYEEELLETAGGIKKAIHHFKGESFAIVNGDIVWGEGFSHFVEDLFDRYDDKKMDFLLALTPVDHERKENGDFRFYKDGRLDFLDKDEVSEISYCGLSIVKPEVFKAIQEGYNPLIYLWRQAIQNKKFYGYKADYPWIDMGTPEGLLKAKKVIKYENGLPAKVINFGSKR